MKRDLQLAAVLVTALTSPSSFAQRAASAVSVAVSGGENPIRPGGQPTWMVAIIIALVVAVIAFAIGYSMGKNAQRRG